MNTQTLVAYREGSYCCQTAFTPEGVCMYGTQLHGKPKKISDYIKEGYLIITHDEAVDMVAEVNAKAYGSKPWTEVSKAEYWDALECLPPENMSGGCFRTSEYLTGNYTAHYIKRANRYYTATRLAQWRWTPYLDQLDAQLKEVAA